MFGKEKNKYSPLYTEQEFDEIFLKYYPLLYHFGMKLFREEYLVEECIQELFIYIYEKNIDTKSINNLKAYLFTSFRRRVLEKKKQQSIYEDLPANPTNIEFSNEDFLEAQETAQNTSNWVSNSLNNLPWRQREAIYLRFFNNLSAKEIGEVMGIQAQVVSNTIYKAIKTLREKTLALEDSFFR